jgi:hypothetical protein
MHGFQKPTLGGISDSPQNSHERHAGTISDV